ncbi:MAG: phage virion morphogenesis protein [Azonexus sp.]
MADDGFGFGLQNQAVIARLNEIARRYADMSPAMKAIGETVTESTKARFETSTAPDGTPWAPNAVSTVLERISQIKGAYRKDGRLSKKGAEAYVSKKPLVDTGITQDSFRWQLAEGGNAVEVGTNRFASEWEGGAAVFHYGRRDGSMPARPILGISPADEVDVLDILAHFCEVSLG